jgi:hypothetical protein
VVVVPAVDRTTAAEKVFVPAKVWSPVVTAPEADALAVGIVALVPVDELIVGPAVVPPVTLKLVATLT